MRKAKNDVYKFKLLQMNKVLKITGIILSIILIIVGIIAFSVSRKLAKQKIAQENAQYIIDNLDNETVASQFPEKHFPRNQTQNLLGSIRQKCDWKNRDGKFVDFFTTKNIGGIDQTAFIYEYYLKCDSLRFIFIYDMDKPKPELFRLTIEPLEKENPMIIFPEKELKNRRQKG